MKARTLGDLFHSIFDAARGAVTDVEGFVASDRALRLQVAVYCVRTAGFWFAVVWAVFFTVLILVSTIEPGFYELRATAMSPREGLVVVLGVALIGPIAIALGLGLLVWGARLVNSFLARLVPRAFAPLVPPGTALAALGVLWVQRGTVKEAVWYALRELEVVFRLAGEWSPGL